jgi:hypothetical protein
MKTTPEFYARLAQEKRAKRQEFYASIIVGLLVLAVAGAWEVWVR